MHLFTLQKIFKLGNGDLILVNDAMPSRAVLAIGQKIKLIRPDLSIQFALIKGLAFSGAPDILIANTPQLADLPIGTEVWLVEQ